MRRINYFATGIAGAGPLILRIALAGELLSDALRPLHGGGPAAFLAPAFELLLSVMISFGFLTALAAVAVVALGSVDAVYAYPVAELPLLVAAMGLSLAMSGPGSWSVDTRIFGLRRVEIGGERKQ